MVVCWHVERDSEVVDEKGLELQGLRRLIDSLELEFARKAAEFAESEEWDDEGYVSAAHWIRFNCHMNSNAVWNALAVGEQEARLGQSIQAMGSDEIGFAHLAMMARTAEQVGPAFDEAKLLPLAKKHSPGKFHYQVLHYRHALDAQGYNQDQERVAEERRLRLSTAQDGCLLINGVLDPVGGAAVRTALEPLAQPSGAHDDRVREQRLADALVELASAGRPAELQVTATIETSEGPGGGGGGGDGVLPAHLLELGPADGLRLQRDQGPAQPGLGDDRCRPEQAGGLEHAAQGAQGPRWALPVAGLRAAGFLV